MGAPDSKVLRELKAVNKPEAGDGEFGELITRARRERQLQQWSGTFLEYLDVIKATLGHLFQLWGARIEMETTLKDAPVKLTYADGGMKIDS